MRANSLAGIGAGMRTTLMELRTKTARAAEISAAGLRCES